MSGIVDLPSEGGEFSKAFKKLKQWDPEITPQDIACIQTVILPKRRNQYQQTKNQINSATKLYGMILPQQSEVEVLTSFNQGVKTFFFVKVLVETEPNKSAGKFTASGVEYLLPIYKITLT
jgi:hypothetical protein